MIEQYVEALGVLANDSQILCTTAESCTGGMVSAAITNVAGSSRWFERGFVTYSNEAKIEMLSVSADTITSFGAVSNEVVREMAVGAIEHSRAHFSVSISGVAGPEGGTIDKPVGTVCFAWALNALNRDMQIWSEAQHFDGSRLQIRNKATARALLGLIALLDDSIEKFVRR